MRDVGSKLKVVQSIEPAAGHATLTGTGVDLAGFGGAAVCFQAAVLTDGAFTPKIQESDDDVDGNYTDVAAGNQVGTLSAFDSTHDEKIQTVSYIGSKRWIRAVLTEVGGSTGGVCGAIVILGLAREFPQ